MGMAVEMKEICFDTMQQELQIGADDVEAFVIDGAALTVLPAELGKDRKPQDSKQALLVWTLFPGVSQIV